MTTKSITQTMTPKAGKPETKGTLIFVDKGDNPLIPTVYVKKSALAGARPTVLSITVEYEE